MFGASLWRFFFGQRNTLRGWIRVERESQTRDNAPPVQNQAMVQFRLLQRKCACGGASGLGGDCDGCSGEKLQRKAVSLNQPSLVPPIVHKVLDSPSQPLESSTRVFMEERFGHDFSRVRIHADTEAAESAKAVGAQAYTVGHHVVFGRDKYRGAFGNKLLAHELAHVVQQRNAAYPAGGITMADPSWEREADSAAEAVLAGRRAGVISQAPRSQLARQQVNTQTETVTEGANTVDVTRNVTAGRCRQSPETRTSVVPSITITDAGIELSYCRGRTRVEGGGEIDYSDIVSRALSAVPNFFTGQNPAQAARDLERSIREAEPRARVDIRLESGQFRAGVTATGRASIGGGASGEVTGSVGGRIGTTGVDVGVTVTGGQGQPTTVTGGVTITPGETGAQEPNCFECTCTKPQITFACTLHEPPTTPPPPPRLQTVFVPLFFEYADIIPRAGWEQRYAETLNYVIQRIREGYTIARIEGRTSPEGRLSRRRGGRFEGNIELARRRAEEAQRDLQAALDAEIARVSTSLLVVRREEATRRLREARTAGYTIEGRAPGGDEASAELFGTGPSGEVAERDMLSHLTATLRTPGEGEPDPLALAHVTGTDLPPEIQSEVEPEIEAFRTGRRGQRALSTRERLETIYRPLRRALIELRPPPPEPARVPTPEETARAAAGRSITCRPEHEAVFDNRSIPADWIFEGECRPPSGRR